MTISCQAETNLPKRDRPRSRFIKFSAIAACLYVLLSWNAELFLASNAEGLFPTFSAAQNYSHDYAARLFEFAREIVPYSVREGGQLSDAAQWAWLLFADHAFEAACFTFCIALLSVLLAAGLGYSAVLLEAVLKLGVKRFDNGAKSATAFGLKLFIHFASSCLTGLLALMRAVPDLIWAYVILSILGPTCWTAIAALVVHNSGILARIGRDIIQNTSYPSLEPLRNSGAGGSALVTFSILPELFSKMLIHIFYRWETCMRDAVIVGMVGLPTLGFWIFQHAWPRFRYDEMMFYIVLSLVLVSMIEKLSQSSRRFLRLKLS